MPHTRREPIRKLVVERLSRIAVHQVKLGVPLRMTTRRMDVQPAKEAAPGIEHPFGRLVLEVLLPESDDAALGDEECQLLFFARGEEVELDPGDFGPKTGRQLSGDG